MEIQRTVPITKVDPEQRIVWGWAYVSELDGKPVVDHSGDVVDSADVQKAAHGFVTESRAGNVMHTTARAGEIVDSLFFSKAVQDALGIDLKRVGWFIGFKVTDAEAWQGVQAGTYKAFSIEGWSDVEDLTSAAAA